MILLKFAIHTVFLSKRFVGWGGNSWSGNYFKRNSLIIFKHINTCSPNYWYETYWTWTMQLLVIRPCKYYVKYTLRQISLSNWELLKKFHMWDIWSARKTLWHLVCRIFPFLHYLKNNDVKKKQNIKSVVI